MQWLCCDSINIRVTATACPDRRGCAFDRENVNLHFGQALLGMTEDGRSLVKRNAWKPREKLINGCAGFEIFEKSLYGNTSSLENPRTTNLSFDALNFRAIAPIQHRVHGMLATRTRQV